MLSKLIWPALSLLGAVLLPACVFAAGHEVAQTQEISLLPLKIALVAGAAISIWGLYQSRCKKIVVFANLTDIFVTLAIPAVPALAIFLVVFLEMKGLLADIFIIAPILVALFLVIKGTYAYNASINAGFLGFALAIFTKLFILTLYIFIMIFLVLGNNKRKGESESAYRKRVRRESRTIILGTTTIFGILAYLGLWDKNFVSLQQFINGNWGSNEAI